jgi:hypothetical protein
MNDEAVNVLAEALEAIEKGDLTPSECIARYPEHREELGDLLDFAVFLKETHIPTINPEFRSAARSRIIQAVTVPLPKSRTFAETLLHIWNNYFWVSFIKQPALSLALVVAIILVLASAGTVYASTSALPGDSLYSVKTSVEDARLWFTSDDKQVELYLQFTHERIREIKALMEGGRFEDIPRAVERFENQVTEATGKVPEDSQKDPEIASEKMDQALSSHKEVLNGLLITAPDQAKPALEHAIAISDRAQHTLTTNLSISRSEITPTSTNTPLEPTPTLASILPPGLTTDPTQSILPTHPSAMPVVPSRTPQPTPLSANTAIPTETLQPTSTLTPTQTPSQMPSPTVYHSQIPLPTISPSHTPQPTQTSTPSVTPTSSPTATETNTQITPTSTSTPSPTSAPINPEACNGVLGAITVERVRVPPGATCSLNGTIVEGDAIVEESGVLISQSARIHGDLDARNSAKIDLLSGTEINGNIHIMLSGSIRIVSIYAGSNLNLESNYQGHEISNSRIMGNVDIARNTGGVLISNNSIIGNLMCIGNEPPPIGNNNYVGGKATGQCAILR